MSDATRSTDAPASSETGFLKHRWRSIRFYFERHEFESKLECILAAAACHEGNSLPCGDHQYRLLSSEATSLCTEFANRWGLDIGLLKARIAGLTKLDQLSVLPHRKNYARLTCLGLVAIPALFFLMGAVAGLINVGYHFVGGR